MTENTRIGRQPYELITVKQDFCNLTWGEGACYAGRTNFLYLSEDILNLDGWEAGSGYDVAATNIIGPDGDASATEVNYNPSGSEGAVIDSRPDLPTGIDGTLYGSISAKIKSGSSIDGIYIFMELSLPTLQFDGIGVDLTDGSIDSAPIDGAVVTYTNITDEGNDWWRIEIGIDRDALTANTRLRIQPYVVSTGVAPASGNAVYIDQPMVTDIQGQAYAPTNGEAIQAVSQEPCYNTRATCQVPDVYDRGTLDLKFSKPQAKLLRGEYIRPSVSGVSITPGKINPGGTNKSSSAIGERATISVSFEDHADTDRLVDKYVAQRGYDPLDRSTFWAKWRARNPYYLHREIVYESGYIVDGVMTDSISRSFFITGFSGPDANGRVTISGKDALTFASNDKAKAPIASTGKLDAAITDVAASLTLTPAGIGDEEYPTGSFKIRIGKEVIACSRTASSDTLTLSTRGTDGTDPAEHDEGDTVQLCLEYTSESPADILYDLLLNYANIPVGFLDKTQWDTEELSYLPNLYSTIITEPEGVEKLVGEMCQQMFFTVWFDERESKVKIRAVRPAEGDTVYELDDSQNFIADSIAWKDKADELVTQVWVYYGRINAAEKLEEGSNYAVLDVIASPDSESADRNNISRIKTIFSRWIPSTGGGTAVDLGERILARYASAPRECTFSLDAKDRDLWLADFVRAENRLRVDKDGLPVPVSMQVYEAQESIAGTRFTYKAQEYVSGLTDGEDVTDPNVRNIVIAADTLNVNLRTLHDSLYAAPTGSETITVTIRNGVTIGGYAVDSNENIAYPDRDDTNDFYNGGTGSVSGLSAGQIPILQRNGIGSLRTTTSGAAYPDGGGNADFEIREYPVSTALDTGTWPVGVTLNLVVEGGGRILGEGGNGSTHGLSGTEGTVFDQRIRSAAPAGDGGHALNIQHDINITNGGIIRCGSGGGGVLFATFDGSSSAGIIPGGGGAGFELSDTSSNKTLGLVGTQREPSSGDAIFAASGGQLGTLYYGGDGGGVEFGSGFDPDGHAGLYNAGSGLLIESGQGGTAGDAINSGANLVTWVNKGDVRGAENT